METQPERTALAWQRTGLGIFAVAGLLGHRAVQQERPVALVLAGAVALLGLAVLGGLAPVRYRRLARWRPGEAVAATSLARASTLAVVVVAVLAAVAVLTPG